MKEKDGCCESPQPAEKTRLQCALDELVAAERVRGYAHEALNGARRVVNVSESAYNDARRSFELAERQVERMQAAVASLSYP